MVWDPSISVVVYKNSTQFVLCGVFNLDTSESITVAFIYASNCEVQWRQLWSDLSEVCSSSYVSSYPLGAYR